MEPRLRGHRMHVGGSYAYHVRRAQAQAPGAVVCECGTWSPTLPSETERAAWHRQHILDVLAGKTRLL